MGRKFVEDVLVPRKTKSPFRCLQATWKAHQEDLTSPGSGRHDTVRQPRSIAQIRRANTNDLSREGSSAVENILQDENVSIHPTSVGMLCPPRVGSEEVSILCNWKAGSGSGEEGIRGLHHLCGISVTPKFDPEGCPISASADYPKTIEHDFKEGAAVSTTDCFSLTF